MNTGRKHIPDMQSDLSHLSREELEQWYNNMAYIVGLLVFQFGTNLTLIVPEQTLLAYSTLGMRRLWIGNDEAGNRTFELREAE